MADVDSKPASIVYEPAAAAELLGVSASGLRRLAPIYESIFGDLKRTGKGDEEKRAREWSSEAVERLQTARALTGRGRPYRTTEAALTAIRDGAVTDTAEIDLDSRHKGADGAIAEALQVLLSEVRALRTEIAELRAGRELPAPRQVEPAPDRHHSAIVRFVLWIERVFKG